MKKKITSIYRFITILLVLCTITPLFMTIKPTIAEENNTNSGVVMRIQLSDISYLDSRDITMQMQACAMQNGMMLSSQVNMKVWLILNNTRIQKTDIRAMPKQIVTANLGRVPVGIYNFEAQAYSEDMESTIYRGEFMVMYTPIPYRAFFLGHGSEFVFESKKYVMGENNTQKIDENYPFTITMLVDDGMSIRTTQVFHNVTNMSVKCPNGYISVRFNIQDYHGYANYENRINDETYTGPLYAYFYQPELYEPMKSQQILRLIIILIAVMVFALIMLLVSKKYLTYTVEEEEE